MRLSIKFILLLIFVCPLLVHGAEVSSDLQAQMQYSKADQLIRVWIELPEVLHGKQLARTYASSVQSRTERNKKIIEDLKGSHQSSQQALLGYLHSLDSDKVKNIKSHWMVNLVEAELTSSEITELSKRNDIANIYPVPNLITIEPDDIQKSSLLSSTALGTNLTYIRADSAWKLGYTGAGSVVCSFDTGVDGEHPALKPKWKGLDGDSSAAWFDPAKQQPAPHFIPDCNLPGGCNTTHGTHTMGIIVGSDPVSGDTVGVAPGAKWISAAVIDIAGVSIVDAFEWAADPDGDPNTSDDVPDVINHSWGIPYVDCDNLFYDLIDNTEALGIVNIFAAGNEGSTASSIRNPANRALDSLDCFAVGNISVTGVIAPSSSRGPSICPMGAIKPNVVAPGTSIRSTWINGTYNEQTGTSMSAPHVSGLVALLRQKNPNATVDEIKYAILNSTNNLGQSVPNNNIGWGRIDCVSALNLLSASNAEPNISLYSFDHPPISAGDTVVGKIVLQNKGATENSVIATIIGTNPALQVLAGTASFGTIAEGDTVRANANFEVIVADTASVGSLLSIDVEIDGNNKTDTVKLFFVVEPRNSRSFVTHNVGNIQFSLTNFGTFGLEDGSFFPMLGGSGFRYKGGADDMFEGGLLIGQNASNISDGIRNNAAEPDGDFQVMPGGDITFITPKLGVSEESFSRFSDARAENPIGLQIEQRSFAFNYAPYQDFIILQYYITNNSGSSVNNLYVGLYLDWDIVNFASNSGGYELADQFSWLAYYNGSSYLNHRGIKVLDPATDGSYTQRGDSAYFVNGPADVLHDGFTEAEKYAALSHGLGGSETFKSVQDDFFQVSSAKISLAPLATDTVAFAILAGDNFSAIQTAALEASNAYVGVVTDVDEVDGPEALPQRFALKQNYPNPFNPSTVIQFELPKKSEYKLEIYNLIGQKIREENATADAGVHEFVWQADSYASGVYLYKLTVDNFTESRKMLLLK